MPTQVHKESNIEEDYSASAGGKHQQTTAESNVSNVFTWQMRRSTTVPASSKGLQQGKVDGNAQGHY
jgi:hypothetical protein